MFFCQEVGGTCVKNEAGPTSKLEAGPTLDQPKNELRTPVRLRRACVQCSAFLFPKVVTAL